MRPSVTRLRYVKSKDLDLIEAFFSSLGFCVQIFSINFVSGRWVVHFFPPLDTRIDVKSRDLE
jgi:hypothetical protein